MEMKIETENYLFVIKTLNDYLKIQKKATIKISLYLKLVSCVKIVELLKNLRWASY